MTEKHLKHIKISEAVKAEIISGTLTEPLPEMGILGRRFNTSRLTMRNALLVLQGQGLIRIEHGNGTFINHSALQTNEIENPNLLDMGTLRTASLRYSVFLTDPDISADIKQRMILIVNSQIDLAKFLLPKKP